MEQHRWKTDRGWFEPLPSTDSCKRWWTERANDGTPTYNFFEVSNNAQKQEVVLCDPQRNVFVKLTQNGLHWSKDGKTWQHHTNGHFEATHTTTTTTTTTTTRITQNPNFPFPTIRIRRTLPISILLIISYTFSLIACVCLFSAVSAKIAEMEYSSKPTTTTTTSTATNEANTAKSAFDLLNSVLFGDKNKAKQMTGAEFDKALDELTPNGRPLFVDFYAPWCSHCKELAPVWDELAVVVGKHVLVAKVDCDSEQQVMSSQGIRAFPTLTLYKHDAEPISFSGLREVEHMVEWLKKNNALPKTFAYDKTAAEARKQARERKKKQKDSKKA